MPLYRDYNRRIFKSLGVRLKQARLRLGLSLEDTARLASISKPYLSVLENDKTPGPPSDLVIEKLATVLELPRGEIQLLAHLLYTPCDVLSLIPAERLALFNEVPHEQHA